MSASLPASMDAERMVAGRRSFHGELSVAGLPRLAHALVQDTGTVAYDLDFGRGTLGDPELHVRLRARLTLECQRTLQPFEWLADVDTWLGLLQDEADAAALPGEVEPLLLEHGALEPRRVIEDELLLALPLVPVKPGSTILQGEWSSPEHATRSVASDAAMTHPFADLRQLLDAEKRQQR